MEHFKNKAALRKLMRTADKQIADILLRYGEPFGGNVRRVQGTAIIYHRTWERIAAQAGRCAGTMGDPPDAPRLRRSGTAFLPART